MDTGTCRGCVQQRFIQNAAGNTPRKNNAMDGVTLDKTLSVRMNEKEICGLIEAGKGRKEKEISCVGSKKRQNGPENRQNHQKLKRNRHRVKKSPEF